MTLSFTKDSFVQNLARGQLLVPYLDRFAEFDEEWDFLYVPKGKDDAWHPSGDCMPSVADLYAKAMGAEASAHGASTQRNFMVGHFWHALLQHIICQKLHFCEAAAIERRGHYWWGEPVAIHAKEDLYFGRVPGIDVDTPNCMARAWPSSEDGLAKVVPQPYHWATGSGDIVPASLPSDWHGVIDLKTMAGAMWKQSWKNGLLPPAFADKYECQVNIYMDFFEEEKALILGVNKDAPHGFVEFEFERNQDLIDAIYKKWEYVSALLDAGPDEVTDDDLAVEFLLPLTGPLG